MYLTSLEEKIEAVLFEKKCAVDVRKLKERNLVLEHCVCENKAINFN